MTVVVSRQEAKSLGLLWYFTGNPCPKGHLAKRSVSNRDCRGCVYARLAAKPEKKRAKARSYWARNIEKCRLNGRLQRQKHRDKRRASQRLCYLTNPEFRATMKARAALWMKANPGKAAYQVARRRSRLKHATPPWLTTDHKRQIRALYIEAAARDGEWHVDHVYPLRGKNSCGLNVPWNLQIITADENRKKGNRI